MKTHSSTSPAKNTKPKKTPKKAPQKTPVPDFVKRAERAFKIVAKEVRAEARRYGLKPLEWE
jgi:hypothetical protein